MKFKNYLLAAALFFIINPAFSQWVFRVNGGYGLSGLGSFVGVQEDPLGTQKAIKGSYGAGINLGGSIGYTLNNHVGFSIDMAYVKGRDYKIIDRFSSTTTNTQGRMVGFAPSIVLSAGRTLINPYASFGLLFGWARVVEDRTSALASGTQTFIYTGQVAVGFQSSVGVDYFVTERTAIFGEVFNRMLHYSPETRVNESNYNGAPNLPDVHFQTETQGSPPNVTLKQSYPFDTWGVNLGLRFAFGSNKPRSETGTTTPGTTTP